MTRGLDWLISPAYSLSKSEISSQVSIPSSENTQTPHVKNNDIKGVTLKIVCKLEWLPFFVKDKSASIACICLQIRQFVELFKFRFIFTLSRSWALFCDCVHAMYILPRSNHMLENYKMSSNSKCHLFFQIMCSIVFYLVRGITALCHFCKNGLMPAIRCSTSLTFWSLFHVISITFCPQTCLGPRFLNNNSLCISFIRQRGFLIHFT